MKITLMEVLLILLIIQITILNYYFSIWLKNKIKIDKRDLLYKNAEKILTILENIKIQAYDKVYKEYALIKNVDRIKLNHKDLEEASTQYVKYIVKYCGENLVSDIIDIYGTPESFYRLLMDGFVTKLIMDEHDIIEKNSEEENF